MKDTKQIHDFKAVEFMREKRDELSELLAKNPSEFRERLEKIRKIYKSKFHQKEAHK